MAATGGSAATGKPSIQISKMRSGDDPKAFLNLFEHSAWAAWHLEDQWTAILIPCLVGPDKQAADMLVPKEVTNYVKMHDAILQTLNLSPESYRG